jgi:hypothetical protein
MIYWRLLISGLVVLLAVYYISVILHCFGVIKLMDKEISFVKAVIPFYYWITKK